MNEKFGISAAMTLPCDQAGTVQLSLLADHARWCIARGCSSVTAFGTTGEGASLGLPARNQILGALAGAGLAPRSQIIAGIAGSSQHDAIDQSRMALDFDCRALLLAPPFYFKSVSDDGLFDWFARVIEKLGSQARNILLYNIPSVTTVSLSVDLIHRLRVAFPDVIEGVKDSSGDIDYSRALLSAHGDLVVLIGDERYLAEGVRLGAQGAISGLANLIPEDLVHIVETGSPIEYVSDMVDEILRHSVVPAVKSLVAHRTGNPIWRNVRPPLVPLPQAEASELVAHVSGYLKVEAASSQGSQDLGAAAS